MNTTTTTANPYDAARALVKQRPGLDPYNYSDRKSFNRDARLAGKDRQPCLNLIDLAEREGVDLTADQSWSRVHWTGEAFEYQAGQYWCTEYRAGMRHHLTKALQAAGIPDETIERVAIKGGRKY